MLTKKELSNLQNHVLGIFQTVIVPEINPNGYILALDTEGNTYPDIVSTHHLVELCMEISPDMTRKVIDRVCNWLINSNNNIQNPFLVTTLASTNRISSEEKKRILTDVLIPNQKASGFIDLYAGFLDGGSTFSTLWAIRIASMLGEESKQLIDNAFGAIESHWDDLHRNSFKGFYYELSNNLDRQSKYSSIAINEILENQNEKGIWDNSIFYTTYIIGNLLSEDAPIKKEALNASSNALRYLFELQNEANNMPDVFDKARKSYVDSAYIQLCIRALISAIRYLRKVEKIDMREKLSASLFGFLPEVYHSAKILNSQLKRMNDQYGNIKENFEHLEKKVTESILKENPYERNVFIMMPFRHEDDERYENIVNSIKETLSKYNFRGWLASDKNITNQLWDNVTCFMLACKYGISIFTRLEYDTEIRVKEFNPNVSLELGFFLSRGKKVLILKDSILPKLPTDLVGHLYEPFNLNKSNAQIPKIIERWVQNIIEEENQEKNKNTEEDN